MASQRARRFEINYSLTVSFHDLNSEKELHSNSRIEIEHKDELKKYAQPTAF